MLKFADLNVEEKSNKIDSFMQNFPNSYLPLLMMYIGRYDLLDIVENPQDSDKQIILQVTRQEIKSFFEGSKWERPYYEIQAEVDASLKKAIEGKNYDRILVSIFETPFYKILEYKDNDEICTIGMRLKDKGNQCLFNIYNILSIPDEQIEKSSIVLLFWLLWDIEVDASITFPYSEKEDEFQTDKWLSAFEEALSKIQAYSREKIWMQPAELTQVVLSKKLKGRLLNPFAGLASYSVNIMFDEEGLYNKDHELGDYYIGQEIDEQTWAVGKLRLLAYQTDSKYYTVSDSSLWTDKYFPNIMSTPPFGIKIMNEEGIMENADNFVLRRSIETMTEGGMTACVVPASFLTRKDSYDLRKRLIKGKLVDTVVALPEGIFLPYTNVKTAIIFLTNTVNNNIKFVDATTYYTVNGRERKLAVKAVMRLIEFDEFPDYLYHSEELNLQEIKSKFLSSICICRNEEIVEKDYSFNVHSYIRHSQNANERYEVLYLDHIFFPVTKDRDEIVRKTKPEKHLETGRLVMLNDLSTNPLLPYFDSNSLPRVKFDDALEAIQGPAMLFSLHGEFRVSLLREEQMVFVPKDDIAAFGYDSEVYYGEYIINELFKPYVKEYLIDLEMEEERTDDDICLITILCPKENPYYCYPNRVPTQKEVLLQERDRRLLALEEQLSELKDKRQDEYIKALRQRKHRIQQVMNELCPAFSLLDRRRNEKGVLHNDDIVGKRTGKTVNDYFLLIREAIDKVENMITHIVDEDEWGESEVFKLKDFLDEKASSSLSDRFTVRVNYNVSDGYGEDCILVALNRDKLETVFENIFSNAQKWGFVDAYRNDYCIRIDVDKPTSSTVRIRVSNNGEPIHSSLDRSRIFEWGIGNHTGYGTWQVKNIIEHYQGTVELHEYPDDIAGFQTEYEIILPAYV
jgi:type I restriction enzyme M protein